MAPDDFERMKTPPYERPVIRPIRGTQTNLELPDLSGEIDVSGRPEEEHEGPAVVSEESTVRSEMPVEHIVDDNLSDETEEVEEESEAGDNDFEDEFGDETDKWQPVSSTASAEISDESSEKFLEELSEEFSEEDLEKASQQEVAEVSEGVMEEKTGTPFPYSQLLIEEDRGTPENPSVHCHLEIGKKDVKEELIREALMEAHLEKNVEEEPKEMPREAQEEEPKTPSKIINWLRKRKAVVSLITAGTVMVSAVGYGAYKNCGADDSKSKKPTAGEKFAHKKSADAGVRTLHDIKKDLDAGIAVKMDVASKDIQDAEPAPVAKPIKPAKKIVDASVSKPPAKVVAKQPVKIATKSPTKSPKKAPSLKVKSAVKQKTGLMNIDSESLNDLSEGKFKRMFNGEPVPVEDMPGGIISRYMEENLLEGASRAEKRAYKKHLKKLEKGWLMYMKHIESKVEMKLSKGKRVSEKDMAEYEWFKNVYSKSNKKRYRQAGWMFDKYQKLKDKKSGKAKWYKKVFKMGKGFMQGLHKLNPHIKSVNAVEPGAEVSFSKKKGKVLQVLGTLVNWAKSMGKKTPKEAQKSTTGEIQVDSPEVMFAANKSVSDVIQDTRSVIVEDIEVEEEADVDDYYAEYEVEKSEPTLRSNEELDVDDYYAEYEVIKPDEEPDVDDFYAEYEVIKPDEESDVDDSYAEYEVIKPDEEPDVDDFYAEYEVIKPDEESG